MSKHSLQPQFDQWKTCVIIPTYNNDQTLQEVVSGVLGYTQNVIVVNDGSTDQTNAILKEFESDILVHHLPENAGKGVALRKGFDLAIAKGYERAITIDSDGQHKASDLPNFLNALEENPDAMIVGARNMGQDNVPGSSSFGHKFSNFWYRVMTGRKLPDTQSGYRLYPLTKIKNMRFYTTKYELEMESLVRLSWLDIPVIPVPIDVYYPPEEERVTHFRKIPDFTRISILNTIMVAIALLYVRPKLFFRNLKKKSARDFFREYILNSKETNAQITFAIMLGLFIGVAPLWGYQIVLILFFCTLLKLNKVIALVAGHISIPPMIPIILYASYWLGGLLLYGKGGGNSPLLGSQMTFADVKENLFQYVVGSFALGIVLAVVFGLIFYILLTIFRKNGIQRKVQKKRNYQRAVSNQ